LAKRSAASPDPLDGVIDEIRISTINRPDASTTATYCNLSDPADFLVARSEETEDGGAPTPTPRRPIMMTICS